MRTQRRRPYPITLAVFLTAYVSYFVSKAVFIICALPLMIVLTPFPSFKCRVLQVMTHHYLRLFTRVWMPLIGAYRVAEISGLQKTREVGPSILVANHRGFMDALLILGLVERTGVMIKSRDTAQAMYGILSKHFDLVSVDRDSLKSVSLSLTKCERLLAEGKNLLIFPEGTRARSGRLGRFNRIAFQLACSTGLPVTPVCIHSTEPFMAKVPGSNFPRFHNEFCIRFLDAETPGPDDNADSLSDRVYRRMARELKTLDAGTCWEAGVEQATK